MQHKKVKIIAIILFTLGVTGLNAQESINASGGNASGSGGSSSYSIGQVFYTSNIGSNGYVVGGVQQPYEISVVIGINEAKDITLQYSAYPNPTKENIILKIENFSLSNLSFYLYDINGKLLENKKIESNETSITMNNLATANYILKVTQNNKEVKTFKIIKN